MCEISLPLYVSLRSKSSLVNLDVVLVPGSNIRSGLLVQKKAPTAILLPRYGHTLPLSIRMVCFPVLVLTFFLFLSCNDSLFLFVFLFVCFFFQIR